MFVTKKNVGGIFCMSVTFQSVTNIIILFANISKLTSAHLGSRIRWTLHFHPKLSLAVGIFEKNNFCFENRLLDFFRKKKTFLIWAWDLGAIVYSNIIGCYNWHDSKCFHYKNGHRAFFSLIGQNIKLWIKVFNLNVFGQQGVQLVLKQWAQLTWLEPIPV